VVGFLKQNDNFQSKNSIHTSFEKMNYRSGMNKTKIAAQLNMAAK